MSESTLIIGGLIIVMVLLVTVKIGNITINIFSNNNAKDNTE